MGDPSYNSPKATREDSIYMETLQSFLKNSADFPTATGPLFIMSQYL